MSNIYCSGIYHNFKMELILSFSLVILTFFFAWFLYKWTYQDDRMPHIPGPKGWPIFGNAFQLDMTGVHKTLHQWSQIYGDIFKIKLFGDNVVVVSDFDSIHEVFMSEACSSRIMTYRISHIVLQTWRDVSFGKYSPQWIERKKLITRSLNAYGTGRLKIETITLDYIDELMDNISKNSKCYSLAIDIKPLIHQCVGGVMTTLLYGKKLPSSDLNQLLETEEGFLQLLSPGEITALLDLAPILCHFPIKAIQNAITGTINFRQWISEHNQCTDDNETTQQSVLNSLKSFINKVSEEKQTEEELLGMVVNVISGGFITTTSSLYALILVLIQHPEIQERMYEEMQEVTHGQTPSLDDRPRMPYMQAVIEENMRHQTLLPLAVPHATCEDTTIAGHWIPKGTMIFPNLWKLHHDEQYFPAPWDFCPERYLTAGNELLPRDHPTMRRTLPFSAGRRMCPGEGLARGRMFLLLANLVQRYRFLPANDDGLMSCDPRTYHGGIVIAPEKYLVMVQER